MSQLLSTAVVSAVGLTCKAFLNSGLCSITVSNLSILLDALRSDCRQNGQGLVTVSNHLSTLDDPLAWGILPFKNFTNPRTIRWTMGASDIMFTNPSVEWSRVLSAPHAEPLLWLESLFSTLFRNGQVIETLRGNGIWQPALDVAIERLNQGHWLHMFSEGKVCQPATYAHADGIAHLPRFKWGVGRIIMETNVLPLIIPMWLTGFDKLMPEYRPFPFKYIPKMGTQLGVTFGDPIPTDKIMVALNVLHRPNGSSPSSGVVEHSIRRGEPQHALCSSSHVKGWMKGAIAQAGGKFIPHCEGAERRAQMDEIRSKVTATIQRAVEDLGRKVSGNMLDLTLSHRTGETRDHRIH